jgi:asparagine synthase (glutamine-hydrolysing)
LGCGIAGFAGLSDKGLLRRMLDVQKHRGPDSTGTFLDAGVGLGIDRLSIIDLKTGDQPIHNEDETVWVTFNGEIYNYLELRSELEALGHRFYTNGDTETIVHAYEQWHQDCPSHFRGMFSFMIWDANEKLLFGARDRFGKKPFYYSKCGDAFVFSSEMKGLLQYEALKQDLDHEAMDYFFTYFYIPSPLTIFQAINKLPPAHSITYKDGVVSVSRYWDMQFLPRPQSEDEVIEKIYALISTATKLRLRSDVPLGTFLSGGIDSGIVTAITKAILGSVKTVTVGFQENDEHIRYGRVVADYLKTEHEELVVEAESAEILPKLVWHFDEPFADPSFVPTYYVSLLTRQKVKVALTGDGGDELFMGYPFLKDPRIFGLYSAMPTWLRRGGLRLARRLPGGSEFKRMAGQALEKNYGDQDFFGRYMLRMVVFTPESLRKFYSKEESARGITPTLTFLQKQREGCLSKDPLDVVDYATVKSYLSEMILTKVDRMSSAVSLEPRSPLLDHELAEYSATIPSELKYRGQTTKYVLKKMALNKNLLPKAVIERKKVGFGPPVSRWMGGEWKDLSAQVVEKASGLGLFEKGSLQKLLIDAQLNSSKIFGLVIFTLWYAQFVEHPGSAPLSLNRLL